MAAILLPFRDSLGVAILAPRDDVEIVPVFRDQFENPIAIRDQLVELPSHLLERGLRNVAKKYGKLLMAEVFHEQLSIPRGPLGVDVVGNQDEQITCSADMRYIRQYP